MSAVVLVMGATGTVGGATLRELHARGVAAEAFVRDPDRARTVLGEGVALRTGNLGDERAVAAALEGVAAVLLCSGHGPGMRRDQLAAVGAIAASDVHRVVKISGSPVSITHAARAHTGADHLAVEQALRATGKPSVSVRPNVFMQNFIDQAAAVGHGALPGPDGAPRVSFVDGRDVGRVAAAALVARGCPEEVLEVTGPEALTWSQVAAVMSAVLGRSVTHYPASAEVAREGLLAIGRPQWLVDHVLEIAALLSDPQAAEVTDTVARLAGGPPLALRDFLREHAAALPALA